VFERRESDFTDWLLIFHNFVHAPMQGEEAVNGIGRLNRRIGVCVEVERKEHRIIRKGPVIAHAIVMRWRSRNS
jgi:hypothetical protein